MGFRVSIDGSGPVNLTEQCVKSVKFQSEIPTDSNARATDNGATLKIWGKDAVFPWRGSSGCNSESGKVERCSQRKRRCVQMREGRRCSGRPDCASDYAAECVCDGIRGKSG